MVACRSYMDGALAQGRGGPDGASRTSGAAVRARQHGGYHHLYAESLVSPRSRSAPRARFSWALRAWAWKFMFLPPAWRRRKCCWPPRAAMRNRRSHIWILSSRKMAAQPRFESRGAAELESIRQNRKEMEARFYGPLEFGTAGLRGTMAVGLHQHECTCDPLGHPGICRHHLCGGRGWRPGRRHLHGLPESFHGLLPGRPPRSAPPTASMCASLKLCAPLRS